MSPLSLVDISRLRDRIHRIGDAHAHAEEVESPTLIPRDTVRIESQAEMSILVGFACASVFICFCILASLHLLLDY